MVRIREAEQEDKREVVRLIQELARSGGEVSLVTEAYVSHYLSSPAQNGILLAEVDGQAVGLISYSLRPDLYHAGDTCLIEEFVVLEERRGSGVGSALMDDLLARLEAINCVELSVSVMLDNLRGQQFYRRHGLTEEALFLERHLGTGAAEHSIAG